MRPNFAPLFVLLVCACGPADPGEETESSESTGGRSSPSPSDRSTGGASGDHQPVEGAGGSISPGPSVACAGSANYHVTFDVTWTEENFPTDYPVDGAMVPSWDAAHMSPLVGGAHDAQWFPWKVGEVASEGTELMAEKGDASGLQGEVEAAILVGSALSVAKGSGVGYPPGSDGASFGVDGAHSLVTLASMLAPSPDWFAGISGFDLCEGGTWRSSASVDAVVYDAGTDNGEGYNYGWQDTQPPAPIAAIASGPFSTTNVVGSFTFTLQ